MVCQKCGKECIAPCVALKLLLKIYNEQRVNEKTQLIKKLRSLLNIIDWEPSESLEKLGNKIIDKIEELSYIRDFEIRIGYVLSYASKVVKGKTVFADTRKVNGPYQAYLPFDIIITFYEPNIAILSENQIKIVMWHELRHITIGEKGITIRPHEVDDWKSILREYGIDWNEYGHEVPDILADRLAGGDFEKETSQKENGAKKQGRKGQKMGSK
jgi:hypothetical protein